MVVSLLVDLIWIIYWAATWGGYNNRESGVCTWTIIISIIVFVLKIVTVILLFINEPDCKAAISELPNNVKSIFKPQNN
jgi:hypothetical protein